jgi:uncharacterized membrane protein
LRAGLPASGTGRLAGVDAARAVALVGMFATHILPLRADGAPTPVGLVADGRSSALFAVLAGVGVALSTGGPRRPADARAHLAAAAALAVRGSLVGLLGLWLAEFDPPVAVILAYYGLLFVVATPLLRLPATVLAVGAVVACVLGPMMSLALRSGLPAGPGDQPGLAAVAAPGALLETLALTGIYPVLPWITYLLAGMAVGRVDLRSTRVAVSLLGGGAVLALLAVGTSALLLGPGGGAAALGRAALTQRRYGTTPTGTWWWLAVDTPHSGAPLDLAHTTGTALAVLGATLLLARWARSAVLVPAALGAVPLTLYTLHVIALAAYPGTVPDGRPDEGALLVGHVLAATAIATALWLAGRRGPFESVVSGAARRVRGALDPARPAPAPGR